MLIDLKRRIIFIAGLKTGSTTIERLFAKQVDIRITRSEWGKHHGVRQVCDRYSWIFDIHPLEDFYIWGVIREPKDWLLSLYRSHQHEKFKNKPTLYTGNMNFREFFRDWRGANKRQSALQRDRFLKNDELCVHHIIPFCRLNEGVRRMAPLYDVELSQVPNLNKSPQADVLGQIDEETELEIEKIYKADFALYNAAVVGFNKVVASDDVRPTAFWNYG